MSKLIKQMKYKSLTQRVQWLRDAIGKYDLELRLTEAHEHIDAIEDGIESLEAPVDDAEVLAMTTQLRKWIGSIATCAAAANLIERLWQKAKQARTTAEYWKAEHLAGNERIAELKVKLKTAEKWDVIESQTNEQLQQKVAELEARNKLYGELLYGVSKKFPNETRHETALRYIIESDNPPAGPAQQAPEKDDE